MSPRIRPRDVFIAFIAYPYAVIMAVIMILILGSILYSLTSMPEILVRMIGGQVSSTTGPADLFFPKRLLVFDAIIWYVALQLNLVVIVRAHEYLIEAIGRPSSIGRDFKICGFDEVGSYRRRMEYIEEKIREIELREQLGNKQLDNSGDSLEGAVPGMFLLRALVIGSAVLGRNIFGSGWRGKSNFEEASDRASDIIFSALSRIVWMWPVRQLGAFDVGLTKWTAAYQWLDQKTRRQIRLLLSAAFYLPITFMLGWFISVDVIASGIAALVRGNVLSWILAVLVSYPLLLVLIRFSAAAWRFWFSWRRLR